MIAEGFLIVQLLEKLSLRSTPISTVGPPQPTKPKTVPPPRGLGLFELGKIEEIKQPLVIDPTKIDYGQLEWKPDYKKGKF
jgi:hypothetical protein